MVRLCARTIAFLLGIALLLSACADETNPGSSQATGLDAIVNSTAQSIGPVSTSTSTTTVVASTTTLSLKQIRDDRMMLAVDLVRSTSPWRSGATDSEVAQAIEEVAWGYSYASGVDISPEESFSLLVLFHPSLGTYDSLDVADADVAALTGGVVMLGEDFAGGWDFARLVWNWLDASSRLREGLRLVEMPQEWLIASVDIPEVGWIEHSAHPWAGKTIRWEPIPDDPGGWSQILIGGDLTDFGPVGASECITEDCAWTIDFMSDGDTMLAVVDYWNGSTNRVSDVLTVPNGTGDLRPVCWSDEYGPVVSVENRSTEDTVVAWRVGGWSTEAYDRSEPDPEWNGLPFRFEPIPASTVRFKGGRGVRFTC